MDHLLRRWPKGSVINNHAVNEIAVVYGPKKVVWIRLRALNYNVWNPLRGRCGGGGSVYEAKA